jgi:hypothetical protein
MEQEPLDLPIAKRLQALRQLDIFHPWDSAAEERLCSRCGEIITGEQIKIFGDRESGNPARLECPTEGCLAVPLEWLNLNSEMKPAPAESDQEIALRQIASLLPKSRNRSSLFGFLRVPHFVI